MLTKALATANKDKLGLRDEAFLERYDIDVVQDKVYALHTDIKKLALNRGKSIGYDKLLIATGADPKKPPIPGIDGKNVYFLRSAKDQDRIKKKLGEVRKGVAIIGSGFIGSESASSIKMKYKDQFDVHLIGFEDQPLQTALGKEVGAAVALQHEINGVKLHMNCGVTEMVKNKK